MAIITTTTLPAFDFKIDQVSRGVCLWYIGAYAVNGGEPGAGWLAGGAIEDGGITYTDKPTIAATAIEQMYNKISAYLSGRDIHAKLTASHIAPEIWNMAHGYPPATLTITPGAPTTFGTKEQFLGEPGDVGIGGDLQTGAGDTPTSEMPYYQFLFLFPSPGFNFATTPAAKWAGIRYYKAYCGDPSDESTTKGKPTTLGFTLHALSDMSITAAGKNKVGIRGTYSVKVP